MIGARIGFAFLAMIGTVRIARDAAVAAMHDEALRYREEAIRSPSSARLAVTTARCIERAADWLGDL